MLKSKHELTITFSSTTFNSVNKVKVFSTLDIDFV